MTLTLGTKLKNKTKNNSEVENKKQVSAPSATTNAYYRVQSYVRITSRKKQ